MNNISKLFLLFFLVSNVSYASKIIGVGGSITETIVALGHKDDLIAIDKSSIYPPSLLKTLPNVGYWLQLPKEGILSLKPDIVIASEKSKPKEFITSLSSFGIQTHIIDDKNTIESAKKKITQVAIALNEVEKSKKIIQRIDTNIAKINKELKNQINDKKVLFIMSRRSGSMMTAGNKTKAGQMITLAGGINASNVDRFTTISEESILKINPDVIIFSDEKQINKLNNTLLKNTKASKNSQIYSMDMLLISGFTVRVDEALFKLSCFINNQLSYCKK